MKKLVLVLLVVCCGCRGVFWNQRLKREATDYAVGQKFELVRDTPFYLERSDPLRMVTQYETLSTGTRLQIFSINYYNDVKLGRTIEVKAKLTSGQFNGRIVDLYCISLHAPSGNTNQWINRFSYSFVDSAYLKRIE